MEVKKKGFWKNNPDKPMSSRQENFNYHQVDVHALFALKAVYSSPVAQHWERGKWNQK